VEETTSLSPYHSVHCTADWCENRRDNHIVCRMLPVCRCSLAVKLRLLGGYWYWPARRRCTEIIGQSATTLTACPSLCRTRSLTASNGAVTGLPPGHQPPLEITIVDTCLLVSLRVSSIVTPATSLNYNVLSTTSHRHWTEMKYSRVTNTCESMGRLAVHITRWANRLWMKFSQVSSALRLSGVAKLSTGMSPLPGGR